MYPLPPSIEMLELVQIETQIAETCMVENDFFYSIHVLYNLPKIGRQCTSHGLKYFLNMNAIDSLAF